MTDIDEILTQATYRRGGARVYGTPDWTRTSVLVCNMQKCWTLPDQPFHRLLPGQDDAFFGEVAGFAATARARGAQVVWLRTVTGPVGAADYWATYLDNFVGAENRGPAVEALLPGTTSQSLDERMDVAEGDWVIDKPRFDAFLKTGLDICCESTVRSAMGRDFATWMPHDLVSAPTVDGHLAGLRSVAQSFAEISPAASLLAG